MSWIEYPSDCHFPIENIPFGIFSTISSPSPRVGTAIGDFVVDLSTLYEDGLFSDTGLPLNVFASSSLNSFMSLNRSVWQAVRHRLIYLFTNADSGDSRLKLNISLQERVMNPMCNVIMHLPAQIGDYTDFYCSREHATNCGIMFRGVENALQPNWLHLPVGYHGRASSVVISGTPVVRPWGQIHADRTQPKLGSKFSQCKALDYELEIGFFVGGKDNPIGKPIKMSEAEDRIFGIVLLNDWSARDVQAWEYVPLGPFTAKSFCTSVSPWVVTLDALDPFRCATSAGMEQNNPSPLPYLVDPDYHKSTYDVNLEVAIAPEGGQTADFLPVTRSNMKYLYWNMKQQLVHHSITGCPFKAGDLIGSGTISGPEPHMFGSMMELSWKASRDIELKPAESADSTSSIAGSTGSIAAESVPTTHLRRYLQDGDTVTISGFAQGEKFRIGFGQVTGTIQPAVDAPY